jgi:hypothetical protein
MGASSSRELEAAQTQVQRLTKELQRATAKLSSSDASTKLAAAASAKTREREAELQRKLSAQQQELERTTSELRMTAADLPRFKQEVAMAKEELRAARHAESHKGEQLSALQEELRASKVELERVFGRIKFAEQESSAIQKIRTGVDERTALAKQHALTVAEASSVLNDASEVGWSTHPVFGELLHDFGHKRLYLGSPSTLWAGTILWERQRAFRQERANLIATAKARSREVGWPGVVSIVETSTGGETGTGTGTGTGADGGVAPSLGMLIDGQHRLGAAHLLSQRGKLTGALERILVEVYSPMEDGPIRGLFTEINRAEPVLLIDLPEGGASVDDNAVLTSAAEILRERYPSMFKPSHGCRPPHVNVDMLREQMHKAELISQHGIGSAEELVEWIEGRNAQLAARSVKEWDTAGRAKSSAAFQKALAKAHDQGLYIGLTWEWLNMTVDDRK